MTLENELEYFREFVRLNVPEGELITDSHLANGIMPEEENYNTKETNYEYWDPDILTLEDLEDKYFFPR
jgi:hypothetical protein